MSQSEEEASREERTGMRHWLMILLAGMLSVVTLSGHPEAQAQSPAWQWENGAWYYVAEDGEPLKGWQEVEGAWYHLDPATGAMDTGWKEVSGSWFFFGESGRMRTGWQKISGGWYYFGDSGRMRTDWQSIAGVWYYFGGGGRMRTGWQKIAGEWYSFADSGRMQTGWQKISGAWYYFRESGKMQTGWLKSGNAWYYLAQSGRMQTGWLALNGSWYFLDESGRMCTGWLERGENRYYFSSSGVMQTGWCLVGEDWYYLGSSGAAAGEGILEIGGKKYAFGENGVWRGEQNETFFAAAEFIESHEIVTDDMTREEKLRACFDWLANKKNFSESNPWIPHYKGVDWPERYASYFFEHTTGNCFGVNAAFAYMAKALGYEAVCCCNSGAHGWAEVDGLVYDPEWSRYHTGNFYALRYEDSPSSQDYGSALRKDVDWRYVKI